MSSLKQEQIYPPTKNDLIVRILLFLIPTPREPSILLIRSEVVLEGKVEDVIADRKLKNNFYELSRCHSPSLEITDNERIRIAENPNGCYVSPKSVKRKCIVFTCEGNNNFYDSKLEKNMRNPFAHKDDLSLNYTRDRNQQLVHEATVGSLNHIQEILIPAIIRISNKAVFGQTSLWIFSKHVPIELGRGMVRDLDVGENVIDEIQNNNPRCQREQVYHMLLRWTYKETPTIKRFSKALKANDLGALADVAECAYRRGIPMEESHFLKSSTP